MDAKNIRQHLEQLAVQCGFKLVTNKVDKNSHYFELRHKGTLSLSVIRISNHCTEASNWKIRYGSNNPSIQLSSKEARRYRGNYSELSNKYFTKAFYSFVIYDPKIDGEQQCGDIQEENIAVKQMTYDATQITAEMLVELENQIKRITSNNITENKSKNMDKNRIRLTESQLHNVIQESVKKVLREMEDGDLEPQYEEYPDFMWTYGTNLNPAVVGGLDPHSVRHSGMGNKKNDNLASWDYFDAVRDGSYEHMKRRLNNHYRRDFPTQSRNEYVRGFNYEDGCYEYPDRISSFKKELDKKWQDTKDIEKYSKMADSRPLWRKGALNGELEESIRRAIRKVLR